MMCGESALLEAIRFLFDGWHFVGFCLVCSILAPSVRVNIEKDNIEKDKL